MTLIVSQACDRFVIQVSDRLVTRVGGAQPKPFDSASNKTVVFQARDGIASLSYTGLSYVGERTTDSWIAELLLAHRMADMAPGTPFTMLLGKREGRWHFMGPALRTIADRLTDFASSDQALQRWPLIVVVAGWRWYRFNRKRPQPFFGAIQQTASGVYAMQYSERLRGGRYTAMPIPSAYLEPHERAPFVHALSALEPDVSLAALVGTIRMVAARTDTVGPDCMSVLISHPFAADRRVNIKYISRDPYTVLTRDGESTKTEVAYGPWLVGRHTVVAPSLMVGAGPAEYRLGHYAVSVHSATPDGLRPAGLAMLHTSQKRPARP